MLVTEGLPNFLALHFATSARRSNTMWRSSHRSLVLLLRLLVANELWTIRCLRGLASSVFSAGVFRNKRPLSYQHILNRNTDISAFCWLEWRRRKQDCSCGYSSQRNLQTNFFSAGTARVEGPARYEGTKTKNSTSCGNVFVTNILFARGD